MSLFRKITGMALSGAFLALAGTPAHAQQNYPDKPVRVVVAFSPGGTTDMLTRSASQHLTQKLGQSFVVENKPGAGGNIGTEFVVRSAADGYTLLVNSVGPIAINQTLYKNLNYDPLVDLAPIVQLADVPNVLVVHPSLPVKDFAEFLEYMKERPDELNYASTGVGTSSHLSGHMLSERIGTPVTHIPYKGADALNDLLSGRVQFMFATIPSVMAHIQKGSLRALAVTSAKRSPSLPELPTVAEMGFPGYEAGSWFGFFAPKDTPQHVIDAVNRTINEALPDLRDQMIREGAEPVGGTPEDFGRFTQAEYRKWKTIVESVGATAN